MTNAGLDSAFKQVKELVERFKANEPRYLSGDYQEAEVRKDFIDKFFIALGWDVNHDRQTNPYEQEVKVEPPVSAGGKRRADYAFHLAPNYRDVRFFVEAKKPSGELAGDLNYFQTIRYGWNSETPLAALTNFMQFHVLDCRYQPDLKTVLNRAIAKYHYSDYADLEKFKEIYWVFSHEAVADGSLEKRAKDLPKPRGKAVARGLFPMGAYQSIDEAFLAELDEYRLTLAKAFKNQNPDLDSETLTELAQRTLDRLVFLRFLEDKGIEPARIVENFGEKGTAWQDFISASRRLDTIYNGIVYKRHAILDSSGFHTDEKDFADICESLAHVNSPYDFNAIPIHILGSIYERFLGKVIVATDKRARVEEKPEVRKAGGVYYTPEYIVRYIVENTVGKLIFGKSPGQIAEMRFADIACGSGSFLLQVFDQLLEYHGKYYNDHPDKVCKDDCIVREGKLYLSLGKKRKILLNNIYGVDIDSQAVEVCQLSLYLKLLQEETEASAKQYSLDFEHVKKMQKLLPDLSKNIVCGNSLIGTDILDGKLFSSDEERKLNPKNFEDIFPEVMKRGGFDTIVGNPPYVRQETLGEIKSYFESHYQTYHGMADLYTYFIEKAVKLLRHGGMFSYIVSNKWMRANYAIPLRKWLNKQHILLLVDFGDLPVFKNAITYPCILLIAKDEKSAEPIQGCRPKNLEFADLKQYVEANSYSVENSSLGEDSWTLADSTSQQLLDKIRSKGVLLKDYVQNKIYYGIKTGLNEAFVIDKAIRDRLIKEDKNSAEIIKPFLIGRNIKRYQEADPDHYIIFFPKGWTLSRTKSKDAWPFLRKSYPAIARHLDQFKHKAEKRYDQGDFWWELRACDYYQEFEKPKIIFPDISTRGNFTYDDQNCYTVNTSYIIAIDDLYLLGILNSATITFFYKSITSSIRGDYLRFIYQYVAIISIAKAENNIQDQITNLVQQMLDSKKQLANAQTDKDKTYYESKCAGLDAQIDRLVYDLYGLTAEEIAIVEGESK